MRNIDEQHILQWLRSENPWWEKPHAIPAPFSTWKSRSYLRLFSPLVADRTIHRAVVLMGPRRVGKTVMIHHAIHQLLQVGTKAKHICYFSVDHPVYNGFTLEELLGFYTKTTDVDFRVEEIYVFLDEIQYQKQWEIHLKKLVDTYQNLKSIASGSAAAALRLKSVESGAGRFTDFLLPPLTFYEYLELLGIQDIVTIDDNTETVTIETSNITDIIELNKRFHHYINFGGYPEVIFSEKIQSDPGRFIKSDIIDKVLLRDLPTLYGIQDIQELNYLFSTLAFNTANEVSLGELSQNSGVAKNTIKKYIEYLEAAFLVKLVHRIDRNAKRFKRANFFKVYLTNPSIRSALFSPITIDDEAIGFLVETAIFSQWFQSNLRLYYARWKRGEVDIVALLPNQKAAWALEAKWSDRHYTHPEELRSLSNFCRAQHLDRGTVTTRSITGTLPRNDITLEFIPASLYCYLTGYNLIREKNIHLVK